MYDKMRYLYRKCITFIYRVIFNVSIKKIRETKPLTYKCNGKVKIVSMLGHTQLDMFLVAIKTFVRFYPNINIDILDDTSLTQDDYSVLKQHIPHVIIVSISTVDTQQCPKRNCWERLVYIIECTKEYYVIQLDSDTVTLLPCLDVYTAIDKNQGFVIGGSVWNQSISTENMSNIASEWNSTHIQVVAEAVLSRLDTTKHLQYLRGCAAFTGFPQGSLTLDMLNEFSVEMEQVIGVDRWNEWGSEQLASNIMLSKTDNPIMLPWPQYKNFMNPINTERIENSSLIHFIGSNRYDKGCYNTLVLKIIDLIG